MGNNEVREAKPSQSFHTLKMQTMVLTMSCHVTLWFSKFPKFTLCKKNQMLGLHFVCNLLMPLSMVHSFVVYEPCHVAQMPKWMYGEFVYLLEAVPEFWYIFLELFCYFK